MFLVKALAGEKFKLTIARRSLSWVKTTILADFQELTNKYQILVTPDINPRRAEQVYSINGSEFAFFGLDYSEKLQGRKQDYTWINEALEIDYASVNQLLIRTTKNVVLDYNPACDSHWVYDLEKRPDAILIKSTVFDNPFIEETIIKEIKGYEPTEENIEAGTADEYMWQVYGLGNRARISGLVYPHYEEIEIPQEARLECYGLDFGYTNHPSACVAIYYYNGGYIVQELFYKTHMSIGDIIDGLKGIEYTTPILCDSADPRMIDEIKSAGFSAVPADKGQGSIEYGIEQVKKQKLYIDKNSVNINKEIRGYKYPDTGKINVPLKTNDHAMDAMRYAITYLVGNKNTYTIDYISY